MIQVYVITVMHTYSSVPNNSPRAFFSKKFPTTPLLLDLSTLPSVISFSLFLGQSWERIALLRKILTWLCKQCFNPFLPNVPFWSPWKHQKTFGFLMFSGGSKGNIGKKRVNFERRQKLLTFECYFLKINIANNKHCKQIA